MGSIQDEDVSDGSVRKRAGSKRTVERIGLDRPSRAEIFRKNALNQSGCSGDMYRVAGKLVRESDSKGSAFARSADARAVVIRGRKGFSQDGLHDGVFDRAGLPATPRRCRRGGAGNQSALVIASTFFAPVP